MEALTSDETAEYVEHLEVCNVCRSLAGQFQQAADILPETLAVETPSPGLKQRVLAQARSDVERFSPRTPAPPLSEAGRPRRWQWPGWLSPIPATAMAVLAVAVVGLMAWNITLRQDVSQQRVALLQYQLAIDALAAGGQVAHIPGTEAVPEAAAALVYDPRSGRSILIVAGLPSLPPDMGYQVWRVREEGVAPVEAGTYSVVDSDINAVITYATFNVANTDTQLVIVPTTFSEPDAIGISIEPAEGSAAPTGDIVLLGEL